MYNNFLIFVVYTNNFYLFLTHQLPKKNEFVWGLSEKFSGIHKFNSMY